MLFLGAGASKPFGGPTTSEMVDVVVQKLSRMKSIRCKALVSGIHKELTRFGLKADIETILALIQPQMDLLTGLESIGRKTILASGQLQSILEELTGIIPITEFEEAIARSCMSINHEKVVDVYSMMFQELRRSEKIDSKDHVPKMASRIFTTNYDLAIETFLKAKSISYSDGFQEDRVRDITFKAKWSPSTRHHIQLYKLHGSIDYFQDSELKVIRSNAPLEKIDHYGRLVKGRMMVYPAGEAQATRSPYFDSLSLLRFHLAREDACLVIGYSFPDAAVINAFVDGLRKNPSLQVVLVGPNSPTIKDGLPMHLRANIKPVKGNFGAPLMPKAIVQAMS